MIRASLPPAVDYFAESAPKEENEGGFLGVGKTHQGMWTDRRLSAGAECLAGIPDPQADSMEFAAPRRRDTKDGGCAVQATGSCPGPATELQQCAVLEGTQETSRFPIV